MEKIKEFISYGFVGILTTLVNYIVYYVGLKIHLSWLVSNCLAWTLAVIFAYIANRKIVFHSNRDIKRECIDFFGLRFLTLILENLLLALCIDGIGISSMVSKIVVSVVTVLANYWFCKIKVFHQEVRYE